MKATITLFPINNHEETLNPFIVADGDEEFFVLVMQNPSCEIRLQYRAVADIRWLAKKILDQCDIEER